ncbi:hypothetical protein LMH81_02790 [Vibrio lentus]|nr:hypothetical protein [Vibrio lentus]MCC4815445.1 hypothetical protein [Vibrio lentus]
MFATPLNAIEGAMDTRGTLWVARQPQVLWLLITQILKGSLVGCVT